MLKPLKSLVGIVPQTQILTTLLKAQQIYKQESPSAGNRKRCTARAVTNPSITCRGGGYSILSFSWIRGVPTLSCPRQKVPLSSPGWKYPILPWPVDPQKGPGTSGSIMGWRWVPPRKDMGPVYILWNGDGVPPERPCNQWKYYGMEMGYPPKKDMGPVDV